MNFKNIKFTELLSDEIVKKYKNEHERFTGYNTVLVKGNIDEIISFIKDNDFVSWMNHGIYDGCNWVYIDLKTKTYAPGIPGIKISEVIFNHAVTLEEFKYLYSIYKYYDSNKVITKKKIM